MNNHYIKRELDDFLDAPASYKHEIKSDIFAALALVVIIGMFVILAAIAQHYGA